VRKLQLTLPAYVGKIKDKYPDIEVDIEDVPSRIPNVDLTMKVSFKTLVGEELCSLSIAEDHVKFEGILAEEVEAMFLNNNSNIVYIFDKYFRDLDRRVNSLVENKLEVLVEDIVDWSSREELTQYLGYTEDVEDVYLLDAVIINYYAPNKKSAVKMGAEVLNNGVSGKLIKKNGNVFLVYNNFNEDGKYSVKRVYLQ